MSDEEGKSSGGGGKGTVSTEQRFWLTNDVVAGSLTSVVCLLMLLDATSYYDASSTVETAFVVAFLTAVVWLFGKGAAKAVFQK